jgi:hydroxypyruvate reductase
MNLEQLRKSALDIFQHSLRAVDARAALRRTVAFDGAQVRLCESTFDVTNRNVYVVGIGKAAVSMAVGLNEVLGARIEEAIIAGGPTDSTTSLPQTQQLFHGGHPLPNQSSLDAAKVAFALLSRADQERALVIFLVSGGGSAMMEWPISPNITLNDLQEANRQLITSGATIREINAVRRSMSAVKGGGLASRAGNADAITLIVSDTNVGDEASVASGPTLAPPAELPNPFEVIQTHGLITSLPTSVVEAIRANKPGLHSSTPYYVLLDNRVATKAAAERANEIGLMTTMNPEINEQPIDRGVELLLGDHSASDRKPSCLISGGEFSCPVMGNGRGGRNLETALRCSIALDQSKQTRTVVLSAGTDGIDGSSFAAGALADENTIRRALELGLDPTDFLERSDSHAFFEELGDLIVTGPTGTNVRDLRIVLRA